MTKGIEERVATSVSGQRDYERALGQFVLRWNAAELPLYSSLLYYSGVIDGVGRAIFSGARASSMIDFIRNINTNTDRISPERWNDLDYLLAQVRLINTERDKIMHHSTGASALISDETTHLISN